MVSDIKTQTDGTTFYTKGGGIRKNRILLIQLLLRKVTENS